MLLFFGSIVTPLSSPIQKKREMREKKRDLAGVVTRSHSLGPPSISSFPDTLPADITPITPSLYTVCSASLARLHTHYQVVSALARLATPVLGQVSYLKAWGEVAYARRPPMATAAPTAARSVFALTLRPAPATRGKLLPPA
jgi:hypothetical protein